MTVPTFVNAGARSWQSFGTDINGISLPASLVNGNLLICEISTGNVDKTFTFPAGWTPFANTSNAGNTSSALAYHIVVGGETNPDVTWSGFTSAEGRIYQYTGVYGTTPIGATHATTSSSPSTTVSEAGITMTTDNAMVAVIICGDSGGGASMTTPSSYTQDVAADTGGSGFGNDSAYHQTTPPAVGGASASVSATAGQSRRWMAYSIEIASQAAVSEADLVASPALGITEAVTLTTSVSIAASPSLGISEAVSLADTQNLTASPALGVSEAAVVQLERDLVASAALGVTMAANLRAANPSKQPVVCITT